LPTILQGEGYARAFCMGSYMTPGMHKFDRNQNYSESIV
jgi:hypothetical protein